MGFSFNFGSLPTSEAAPSHTSPPTPPPPSASALAAADAADTGAAARGSTHTSADEALPWGRSTPIVYEAKRPRPSCPPTAARRRRRSSSSPERPEPAAPPQPQPPPLPGAGCCWPAWTAPDLIASPAACERLVYEGREYCYPSAASVGVEVGETLPALPPGSQELARETRVLGGRGRPESAGSSSSGGGGGTDRPVYAMLPGGQLGPAVGWLRADGGLSLSPGEWVGELLDAAPLPRPAAPPPAPPPTRGCAVASSSAPPAEALARGEPWTLSGAVDAATLRGARAEVEELIRAGRLRAAHHGQRPEVRDDLVACDKNRG
jgi:hypothetical protein